MKFSSVILIIVVVVAIVGGIFWFMQQATTPASNAPVDQSAQTDMAAATTTPTVTLATSDTLGDYLAAGTNGMTLYTYASDSAGVSNCTDTCATNWPPYTVASADGLAAGQGLTGTLGTITRSDGTLQVTYNGTPLYFWSQDVKPGDTTGDGNGGLWSVAKQ